MQTGEIYLTSELRALPCHHLDSKMLVPLLGPLVMRSMPQTVPGYALKMHSIGWRILLGYFGPAFGREGALGGGGG